MRVLRSDILDTLDLNAIKAVADDVYARLLGPLGFQETQVRLIDDLDLGGDALMIDVYMGDDGDFRRLTPEISRQTFRALREALHAAGEDRFPGVMFRFSTPAEA